MIHVLRECGANYMNGSSTASIAFQSQRVSGGITAGTAACRRGSERRKREGVKNIRQFEDFLDSPSLDMLWSDPNIAITEFDTSPRGCGVLFGPEALFELFDRTNDAALASIGRSRKTELY
jgi:hypothetical protein